MSPFEIMNDQVAPKRGECIPCARNAHVCRIFFMEFQTLIKACFSILLFSGICLPEDEAFISMNGACKYPAVATDGKNVFLAWLFKGVRQRSIYFQRSIDEGRTWESARRLSRETGDCMPPSMAVNSGILHLVWIDCGEVIDGELYYTRSLDGGETWEKEKVIVGNVNSSQYPILACGESSVYLIWQDVQTRVFFKVSNDRGLSWEKETFLGKAGKGSCYCFPPALSANGKEVTVVWTDIKELDRSSKPGIFGLFRDKEKCGKRVASIVCRKSADNGRTWSKERILTSNTVSKETADEIDNPIMVSDGSRSYLFWQDKHNQPLGEILYARINNSRKRARLQGKPFFPTPKRSPKCPSAVFDNDKNLHVAWTTSFSGESIVHYGVIASAGNILEEKKDIASAHVRYNNPIVSRTSSGILHIFWFDELKGKEKTSRIFLQTSMDNGMTWRNRGSQTEGMTE